MQALSLLSLWLSVPSARLQLNQKRRRQSLKQFRLRPPLLRPLLLRPLLPKQRYLRLLFLKRQHQKQQLRRHRLLKRLHKRQQPESSLQSRKHLKLRKLRQQSLKRRKYRRSLKQGSQKHSLKARLRTFPFAVFRRITCQTLRRSEEAEETRTRMFRLLSTERA